MAAASAAGGSAIVPEISGLLETLSCRIAPRNLMHDRHCERSEAIQRRQGVPLDCFATLAMTALRSIPPDIAQRTIRVTGPSAIACCDGEAMARFAALRARSA